MEVNRTDAEPESPYRSILSVPVEVLSSGVQASLCVTLEAEGTVDVWGAESAGARLIHWAFRYPRPGLGQAVRLLARFQKGEVLVRRVFDGRPFQSIHQIKRGRLVERFGPVSIEFELLAQDGNLQYRSGTVRLLGLKLPRVLRPTIVARVGPWEDGWTVEVRVDMPKWGQICRYRAEMRAK